MAEEKGYFRQAGLEIYTIYPHSLLTKHTPRKVHAESYVADNKNGAYQTYEAGRDVSISCACHWTVNMAASDRHGKLWGKSYSISPCAVVVPADSGVQTPEDLAGVEVHVGYQSGSHYTTIQALESLFQIRKSSLSLVAHQLIVLIS